MAGRSTWILLFLAVLSAIIPSGVLGSKRHIGSFAQLAAPTFTVEYFEPIFDGLAADQLDASLSEFSEGDYVLAELSKELAARPAEVVATPSEYAAPLSERCRSSSWKGRSPSLKLTPPAAFPGEKFAFHDFVGNPEALSALKSDPQQNVDSAPTTLDAVEVDGDSIPRIVYDRIAAGAEEVRDAEDASFFTSGALADDASAVLTASGARAKEASSAVLSATALPEPSQADAVKATVGVAEKAAAELHYPTFFEYLANAAVAQAAAMGGQLWSTYPYGMPEAFTHKKGQQAEAAALSAGVAGEATGGSAVAAAKVEAEREAGGGATLAMAAAPIKEVASAATMEESKGVTASIPDAGVGGGWSLMELGRKVRSSLQEAFDRLDRKLEEDSMGLLFSEVYDYGI